MLVTNPFAGLNSDSVAPGKTGFETARDRVGFKKREKDFSQTFEAKIQSRTEGAESAAKRPNKDIEPNDRIDGKNEISNRQENRLKKLLHRILPETAESVETAAQDIAVLVQNRIDGIISQIQKNDLTLGFGRSVQDGEGDPTKILFGDQKVSNKKPEEINVGLVSQAVELIGAEQKTLPKNGTRKTSGVDSKEIPVGLDSSQDQGSSRNNKVSEEGLKPVVGIVEQEKSVKTLVVDLRDVKDTSNPSVKDMGAKALPNGEKNDQNPGDFMKLLNDQKSSGEAPVVKTIETPIPSTSSLKQVLPAEIVKQSTIVLRGNDNGEIRMILKPDNLGQVKIHVELKDNRVVAKIVVDNQAIREILQDHMGTLKDQFLAQGFSDASINVSVGQDSNGKRQDFSGFADTQRGIKTFEQQVPEYTSGYFGPDVQVNVMA